MRAGLLSAGIAFALIVTNTPTHAQSIGGDAFAFPVPDYGMSITYGSVFTKSYREKVSRKKSPPAQQKTPKTRKPAPTPLAAQDTLRFKSSAQVSARSQQQFRQALLRKNPAQKAAIDQAFKLNWLQGYADEIARPNGLQSNNIADAFTAYLIAGWALYHQVETISPASIRAVRDDMRDVFAQNRQITLMDDATKQAEAEAMIYNTVLLMGNRIQISKSRDKALLGAAKASTDKQFTSIGIDLSRMKLTASGFSTI